MGKRGRKRGEDGRGGGFFQGIRSHCCLVGLKVRDGMCGRREGSRRELRGLTNRLTKHILLVKLTNAHHK